MNLETGCILHNKIEFLKRMSVYKPLNNVINFGNVTGMLISLTYMDNIILYLNVLILSIILHVIGTFHILITEKFFNIRCFFLDNIYSGSLWPN